MSALDPEPTQAILPEGYVRSILEDLEDGDVVYAAPWAMLIDEERRCWLNPKASFERAPSKEETMRVWRHGDEYHVSLATDDKYRWSLPTSPQDRSSWIPVTDLLMGFRHSGTR